MPIILTILFGAALVITANVFQRIGDQTFYRIYDGLLLFMNLTLLLLGALFTLIPAELFRTMPIGPGAVLENLVGVGLTLTSMALWGGLISIRPIRRQLARWLPFDDNSPVHALALVLSGYLAGSTLLTLTQGGLENLAASAVPADVTSILVQFLMFATLALFGTGLLTRRDVASLRRRLGLERPTRRQLWSGLKWMLLLVIIQWTFGAISALINPGQLELLDDISSSLLGDIDTFWEWLVLALATGIGEELLFRGALQPVLGLNFTALLFAIAHVQYGITAVTFAILIIGIALGHIRSKHNTTTAMFVHSGYNFILGVLALVAANI